MTPTEQALRLAAEFNRYFTSANGVDVPTRVSVSRDEWRALFAALSLPAAEPMTKEQVEPRPLLARSLSEWHEDDGTVMWWAWNGDERGWAGEAAYIGSPLCDDWPGYHTHWTPHPPQPAHHGIGKGE